MVQVKFKWISRAKFNALTTKDSSTIYFIYNEHVLYKGDQEYGGIQSISSSLDDNGNYVITVTNGDGTTEVLNVAASNRLQQAITLLNEHINTKATEVVSGHTKITDTISEIPQQVSDNVAATPKAVANYVANYQWKSFLKFDTYVHFPIVGRVDVLYLAEDTGYLWIYENQHYKLIADNWKTINEIQGIIN